MTNTQNRSESRSGSLTRLQWAAIALVAITGVLHVYAGVVEGRAPVALAGVGYAGAIALFLRDYRRRLLYLVGIPYTGFQIVAWYAINRPAGPADIGTATAIDKVTQLALIVVLVLLYQWEA